MALRRDEAKSEAGAAALLILLLASVWLIYQPGLRGGFLFDDFGTLSALTDYGRIESVADAKRFVLSGGAGPSGRPLALATFLLDLQGWPDDALPFKRTSVLLHLLAGALVSWLGVAIIRIRGVARGRAAYAGVLGAAIWLLHPLLVSTALYVVQRMAILAAIFVIAGLVAHIKLRSELARSDTNRTATALLAAMTGSLGLFTVLATLSKENGVLLPTLALVLELTVLVDVGSAPRPAWLRAWSAVALGLPTLLILGYLAWTGWSLGSNVIESRGFNAAERLLSEGRVMVDYLKTLLIPRIEDGGLYHDDFAISKGLLKPPATLLCWILIATLLTSAWKFRRRWPLGSGAILFFFAAQLLESTSIPLELYFEHRNYLPAVMLAIAAGGGIVTSWPEGRGSMPPLAAGMLIVSVLASITAQRVSLWGQTDALLVFWAEKSPGSERAQLQAAQAYLRRHDLADASRFFDQGLALHPGSVTLLAVKLSALCAARADVLADFEKLRLALEASTYGPNTRRAVEALFASPTLDECAAAPPHRRTALADALLSNASVGQAPTARQQALYFKGLALLDEHRPIDAFTMFGNAIHSRYEYEAGMRMVSELAEHQAPGCAIALLDQVEHLDATASKTSYSAALLLDATTHQLEFEHLRKAILRDFGPTAISCT